MAKTFNYKQSLNMVCAVSTSYVKREEIYEYFKKNFKEDKIFTPDELKQIVGEVVKGKKRITQTMDEIGIPYMGSDTKKKYYSAYTIDDDEETR